jgi:hypothetical protein
LFGGMSIRIIAVNDVYELANFPRLRTLFKQLSEDPKVSRTVCFLAGDFVSPSILSSMVSSQVHSLCSSIALQMSRAKRTTGG